MTTRTGTLLLDLVLLGMGIFGLSRLSHYPAIPFEYRETPGGLEITSSSLNELPSGAIIRTVNTKPIRTAAEMAYCLSESSAGSPWTVSAHLDSTTLQATVTLPPLYQTRYIVITGFVAFVVMCVGLFVYARRPAASGIGAFHWLMTSLMLTLTLATEQHVGGTVYSIVFALRLLYGVSFALIPPLFVSFALDFLRTSDSRRLWMQLSLFVPAVIVLFLFSFLQHQILYLRSFEAYSRYVDVQPYFYSYVFIVVVLGLSILLMRYVRAPGEERKQFRWVLWGISVAAIPYIFFRALPVAFGTPPLISEELANVFFLAGPASIGIAIVKGNLLDIDVVINRTIVYMLLSAIVVLLYVLTVNLVALWAGQWIEQSDVLTSTILILTIALLFQPSKQLLQNSVDKTFYRMKYDLQRALVHATGALTRSLTVDELAEHTMRSLQHYLQLKGVCMVIRQESVEPRTWTRGTLPSLDDQSADLISLFDQALFPILRRSTTEPSRVLKTVEAIDRSGVLQVLFPLVSKNQKVMGYVGLAGKQSERIFLLPEIEFAGALVEVTSSELHRLQLQQRAILDALEKERLEKEKKELESLQKMREDLSHMIVHDLRSPLTGLLLGLDLLRGKLGDTMEKRQADILESAYQSGKQLIDMVNDLLEIYKMEEGQLKLVVDRVELKELVTDAIRQVEMIAMQKEIGLHLEPEFDSPPLLVDKEKITRVFVNLLSNSIKFSESKTRIDIEAHPLDAQKILIAFKDQGKGIPPEYVHKVFDKFVQVESAGQKRRFSTGLGLTFCKLAVEKHGGRIWAESRMGHGSTFFVELPSRSV